MPTDAPHLFFGLHSTPTVLKFSMFTPYAYAVDFFIYAYITAYGLT